MRSGLVFSSLTAITLALAIPAFAQQPPAGTAPGHMAAQGQNQKLSAKDRSFAQEAAMGGMAEVELGKLAQQNAQNDEVKQFGSRMVQDHSQANQQLMPILSAESLTMPQQLDEKHKTTYDRLSKMRGAEFDRAYMRDMVQDHEKDVKKFRQEAEHGNDPTLKNFAQNTLPVLEQHLKMAHDVNKSLTAVGSSGQPQSQKNR